MRGGRNISPLSDYPDWLSLTSKVVSQRTSVTTVSNAKAPKPLKHTPSDSLLVEHVGRGRSKRVYSSISVNSIFLLRGSMV